MKMDSIVKKKYYSWLCHNICNSRYRYSRYRNLLDVLINNDFSYTIEMDANRYADGVNLRYRYGQLNAIPEYEITHYLDNEDCSILEMMIALAIRCEEDIMENFDEDRTSEWFWRMIESLGLDDMTNNKFNINKVVLVLKRFLSRTYTHDGYGSLFYIPNSKTDLREMEIWYQMNHYLSEVVGV